MSDALSPQTEQFISEALAAGRFASRSELIEAAVQQMHEEAQWLASLQTPEELAESLRHCDSAINEIEAGRGIEMTPERWKEMRERVRRFGEEKQARKAST